MGEMGLTSLETIRHLLLITSTYGDGEPPDNAASLHALIHSETATALSRLSYSVLALGDSSYPDFCKCGHDFDQRLSALGGTRLCDVVECDVDYDIPFETWSDQIQKALTAA
jgi:sulfite reductase (NADPH) flavoprotein alpha-component